MKHGNRIIKPIEDPLSQHALFELSLFSTCIFVFSALLMQFILTLNTAFFLRIFSLSFQYRLFDIRFLTIDSTKWSEAQIYLVFGSGPLILSAIGLKLLSVLKKNIMAGWKTKLTLTWTAFLMVHALPCGIVAGVFFFDGFGMAFQWLISSYLIRVGIALLVLIILMILNRFWLIMFLKAAYTSAFLDYDDNYKLFLKNVYFKPWIYGLIILMLFNLPFNNLYWPAFLLSLGYLAIPAFNQSLVFLDLFITKSEKMIFTTRSQVWYIAVVLALIWIAGNLTINF